MGLEPVGKLWVWVGLALCICLGRADAAKDAPAGLELKSSTKRSRTGYFRLHWREKGAPKDAQYILQQSMTPGFSQARILYKGSAQARVLSGLVDGRYHFRVRRQGGAWSPVVRVAVKHYPLSMALFFLALGALVFFATAALLIGGHIHAHRSQTDQGGAET